jgi:hypothetical protein
MEASARHLSHVEMSIKGAIPCGTASATIACAYRYAPSVCVLISNIRRHALQTNPDCW